MKIALVGWGLETQSAFRYLGTEHQYLIVSEEPRSDFPTGPNITVRSNKEARQPGLTGNVDDTSYLHGIEGCDRIIVSPTAQKTLESAFGTDHAIWGRTTTNTQLFFEACPTRNIIGVTGTKGKGTTSSLIAEILTACDLPVHLGGNIGIPALDLLERIQPNDWVVLELSNFQLYKLSYSPHIAVHLMMMPEHVSEWHGTMEDYVMAKRNIFAHQNESDVAIYYPDNSHSAKNVAASPGKHITYMYPPGAHVVNDNVVIAGQSIVKVSEVALRGAHNLQNICAAVTAAWQVNQDPEATAQVLRAFGGLEHRLQLVRKLDGVEYIDDSFGTTPDTAIVAMDAVACTKVMIVGGHDKGGDMSAMTKRLMSDDIRSVIGIGMIGHDIIENLKKAHCTATLHTKEDHDNWTMTEIVERARSDAKSGDCVLLSAGTSSFGIFKDYKERGNQFIDAVNKLEDN